MKKLIITAVLMMSVNAMFAQKYITRTGKVSFFSSTPIENIEAFNNEVASIIDADNGEFAFQVPIKGFKFEKALMQEHFNESYMESHKYPKATYKGTITDIQNVNFAKDGEYKVNTAGQLTIHGVTKQVSIPGIITVKGGEIMINSKFTVKPADYEIKIPGIAKGKIADDIEVTMDSKLNKK